MYRLGLVVRRVVTTAAASILLSVTIPSNAAAFGDSVIVGGQSFQFCHSTTIASLPLTLSATSRVFASTTVSSVYWVAYYVRVMDETGTTVLGVTASAETPIFDHSMPAQVAQSAVAQGIVHVGSTPMDTAAPALSLPPGNYQLQLRTVGSASVGCNWTTNSAVLSYIVLSAYYDRIFADGFV